MTAFSKFKRDSYDSHGRLESVESQTASGSARTKKYFFNFLRKGVFIDHITYTNILRYFTVWIWIYRSLKRVMPMRLLCGKS
jgi:hypothetical protein